jgi:hypothetical protein
MDFILIQDGADTACTAGAQSEVLRARFWIVA